ncbi:winged helix-turn-helix domain-containing protein [Roseobacter sp. YSTF-M11]|uniref:Winged helix-turn-helix domain-containing protein n=1 Tax=Roseobacter insulae TaxID=2859783 RepID=A0A9X1FZN3_9RHOB|nr:winged helix-turn-helix domain-containing protein [Roseobacter insulae]MBW4710664.1 winged helix-turn-helix domain-containing protein [Roseobacter insulae]
MKEGPDIARIAALIGDPARANMLTALMTGKALTATELATEAGITGQTASSHLSKMDEGGLLRVLKQGRHKYFSLANDDVASVLEGLMGLAARSGHLRTRTGPKEASLRKARVCYNHLAGDMGTRMFDSFLERGFLKVSGDALDLTAQGGAFMQGFGVDMAALRSGKAPLCKECLDWSARRSHLAGSLGRAILSRMEELGWAKRTQGSRVVTFSRAGEQKFRSEILAGTG